VSGAQGEQDAPGRKVIYLLIRATAMRSRGVRWPPWGGPRGNICPMGIDQGESWATKMLIRGIQERQYGGPGGFTGDNGVD